MAKGKSLFFLHKKDRPIMPSPPWGPVGLSVPPIVPVPGQRDHEFRKRFRMSKADFGLRPTSLPRSARRIPARFQESVPYLVNGSCSRGGASSVIIRNGQPEVKLGE